MQETESKYMSVMEMAEYLNVGRTLAYRLAKTPGFPSVRLSKAKYVISREGLEKWLAERSGKVG